MKLTAYVYIKRAGKKQGENIYKEMERLQPTFTWLSNYGWCMDLAYYKVPEVHCVNKAP